MKLIKMKYKNFEFPVNPFEIKLSSCTDVETGNTVSGRSISEALQHRPVVVSGRGELFGERASEWCAYLQRLIKDSSPGWLFTVCSAPVFAYFSEFVYSFDVKRNCISYSFKFVQADTKKEEKTAFGYTYALSGENAFDIAYRSGVSVNSIMCLNDFKTPFDIAKGDKVVLK